MDSTVVIIYLGTLLIGGCASLVGTFTYLNKKALIGDAISHSILPGIVLAYIFSGERNAFYLLLGAIACGWCATQLISWLQRKTTLKQDTLIAATLSIFFALGLTLLSYIQGKPDDGQSGLNDFLFGKIAAINELDLMLFAIIAVIVLLVIIFRSKVLLSFAFNKEFMISTGFSQRFNDFLLNTLTILVVSMGVQAVGVVLMSALLIIPVVTARMLVNRLNQLLILSVLVGVIAAVVGAYISTLGSGIPTGPCIILVLSFLVLIAFCIQKMGFKNSTHE